MGRKNQSEEKRQVILDAFEAVILREGYAKASQRKIAEEAGMNQPMIHHYFSGGDEMLEALLERITSRYREALSDFSNTQESFSLEDILSFLCSNEFHQVSLQNEVMFHLIWQARHNEKAQGLFSTVYKDMLVEVTSYLERAGIANAENLAYIVMCLIIGHDKLRFMGFGDKRNELMANTLETLVGQN